MRKHDCGVALYPPPEVGGFTATTDKTHKNRSFWAVFYMGGAMVADNKSVA